MNTNPIFERDLMQATMLFQPRIVPSKKEGNDPIKTCFYELHALPCGTLAIPQNVSSEECEGENGKFLKLSFNGLSIHVYAPIQAVDNVLIGRVSVRMKTWEPVNKLGNGTRNYEIYLVLTEADVASMGNVIVHDQSVRRHDPDMCYGGHFAHLSRDGKRNQHVEIQMGRKPRRESVMSAALNKAGLGQ